MSDISDVTTTEEDMMNDSKYTPIRQAATRFVGGWVVLDNTLDVDLYPPVVVIVYNCCYICIIHQTRQYDSKILPVYTSLQKN